ncbi:MAG: hypothetical protein FOGNACKC_04735 [Anaerolineae bacterium]|nr:hypothetical protein [Anaerolineae bacterium]
MTRLLNVAGRLIRWFFGSPFQELPPEFGDPVPPDLRRFEEQAAAIEHQPQGKVRVDSSGRKAQTKPAQADEFLTKE